MCRVYFDPTENKIPVQHAWVNSKEIKAANISALISYGASSLSNIVTQSVEDSDLNAAFDNISLIIKIIIYCSFGQIIRNACHKHLFELHFYISNAFHSFVRANARLSFFSHDFNKEWHIACRYGILPMLIYELITGEIRCRIVILTAIK
ncbi:hypothetical protein BDF21DRAFT_403070 [Thamnidium elegans]|nr:hypothetical protein BDF21DRAFT_403070 [Thamnidium elegans]